MSIAREDSTVATVVNLGEIKTPDDEEDNDSDYSLPNAQIVEVLSLTATVLA